MLLRLMTDFLPCVELDSRDPAQYSVIWMHGLGATGHDFPPIVPHLEIPERTPVRFIFPHAPSKPVTINNGFVMPAWYDIFDADLRQRYDLAGVEASSKQITELMNREVERGVPFERQVLAGFSQGGAMAMYMALRIPEQLAGVIALSCYMVSEDTVEQDATPAGRSRRAFLAHGELDPMVPLEGGVWAQDQLKTLGWDVTWNTYPMQHEVCMEEIRDLGAWLRETLSD
jgi:phospholipase/carboxylesterase